MTIALRGAGQTANGTAGTCTLNLSSISGLAEGDIVVVFVGVASVSAASDPVIAGGWTDCGLGKVVNSANTAAARAYYKVMGPSPDASAVITGGASGDGMVACCFAFQNVNPISPVIVTPTSAISSSTNPDPPAITPLEDNACIVIGGFTPLRDTSPTSTVTNYLPSTPINDNNNATRAATAAMAYRILSGGAGVPENPTAFTSWSTSAWIAMTVALHAEAVEAFAAPPQLTVSTPTIGQGVYGILLPAPVDLVSAAAYLEAIPAVSLGTLGATLTANNLAVSAPTLGQPVLARIVNAAATTFTDSAPTLGQPVLGVVVNTTATALTDSAPTIGQGFYGRVMTASSLTDSAPTIGQGAMVTVVALAATSLTDSPPTLDQGAYGRVITATVFTDSAPTLGAPVMAVIVNAVATSLTDSAPTIGQGAYGRVLTASSLTDGVPTLGAPVLALTVPMIATAYADSAPTIGSSTLGVIVNSTANALADSAPTINAATMAVVVNAVATNATAGAPTLGTPTATVTVAITATPLSSGVRVFGTATVAIIVNATATALAAGAPTINQGVLGQQHVLATTTLTTSPPTIGVGSMAAVVYDFIAGSIAVPGPIISTPAMVPIILLSAANLATAPPVEAAAAIGQKHVLVATAAASSPPTLGSSTIAQAHALLATNLAAGAPVLGTPTLVELVPDLVLMTRVLDGGLNALRTEADKVLALTGTPYSYAEAVALSVGESLITFDVPAAATGGRKIAAFAIVNGIVTGTGLVHRWAVVDSANSRLLAHGDLTGDNTLMPGMAWTLDPIVVVLPGVP